MNYHCSQNNDVDIETVEPERVPPYDQAKARSLMTECESNVNFARLQDVSEDWEERIANTRLDYAYFFNLLFECWEIGWLKWLMQPHYRPYLFLFHNIKSVSDNNQCMTVYIAK